MRAPRARLARLVRALLACCALLSAWAPSPGAWGARDASVYVAAQPGLLFAARSRARGPVAVPERATRERTPLRQAQLSRQLPVPALRAACVREDTLAPRSDERYRYLALRLLLC